MRDFKHAMMTMGEKMGEREIDEIVNELIVERKNKLIVFFSIQVCL